MNTTAYGHLKITTDQASQIAWDLFNIKGTINLLPGEVDFNFKIKTPEGISYILKISRPNVDDEYIDFQQKILHCVAHNPYHIETPKVIKNKKGNTLSTIQDINGNERRVRLLNWVEGRLWSSVNPIQDTLLYHLGSEAGKITQTLQEFDHPKAHRVFEWDIAQIHWTFDYFYLFTPKQQEIAAFFQKKILAINNPLQHLRKSVIHNDVNNHNIIVSNDLINPKVKAIIDYGDAIYTHTINDLAITIAYAIMDKPDALNAALPIIQGYHKEFPLLDQELYVLYTLVASRLLITATKSAINKQKEPDNEYLLISEKPAWDVLEKWYTIHPDYAYYNFRSACGFTPHPEEKSFKNWVKKQSFSLKDLFPSFNIDSTTTIDMSVSSTWLGNKEEYTNHTLTAYKIDQLKQSGSLVAGGYSEIRPFYSTDVYKKEGNNGPQYRTMHLGIDFWVNSETPIHALLDGTVYTVFDNHYDKDYGPTLILEHQYEENKTFYSLYGHLSKSSLTLLKKGQKIKKGEPIGFIGNSIENGSWVPHLHFQIILNMLGNQHNFPSVAFPSEKMVWQSICPNPNLLFKLPQLETPYCSTNQELIEYRTTHLGKSLSLSYDNPLKIVRGEGVFLIDQKGQKFLDTVNNVAHVGHEHTRVIKAGQQQMAVLNTNSRYLHANINHFAEELLKTFPKELSVVHFVNSGSEANELALRMAQAYTNQKDMIAVEVGYHGNTNGCIDISSYKFDGKGGKGTPEHTHIVPLPDHFRGIYQGENTGKLYASHVEQQIKHIQSKGRNLAGFICESIISCGGQIELPKNYLKLAYEAVRKVGGICISDEVQVGCGRVGETFWGFQLHDVTPDIVTIGKPIGNGHPLAAVVCTQEIANAFANGMEYFNTFGGNPVSSAIGKEVLQVIQDENLQYHALEIGNYLIKHLKQLQNKFPIIGDVRGKGLFLGFELTDEKKNPLPKKASYLANRMKELGVLMSTDGPDYNVLKIKPPMVFSKENADELIFRLETVFNENFMKS